MTVMLHGLVEIRMEMSLLEMGVQLKILPTTSLRTKNATLYWCVRVFLQVPDLVSLIRGSSSKRCPSDLGKAHPGCPIDLVL